MSHIVQIATRVKDAAAVTAACQRLNLAPPTQGTAKLYSGDAAGLLVQLPGWKYPVAIDTASGNIAFDNFENAWGDRGQLDKFLQMYAVELVRIEARRRGHTITEQQLQDGSVRMTIQEAT
ncbi:MAG: DUF1257 domain-containing protein [Planctomycetia bacterium]|nr:DUF1257 domain-containing protein [Planctomycetia bacterium]